MNRCGISRRPARAASAVPPRCRAQGFRPARRHPTARLRGQPARSDALGALPRAQSSGAASEASGLGPETGRALRARGRVGGEGEAPGFSSASRAQRQGRGIRGRETHRARTWARWAEKCGQFSGTSNEPIFAAIGARGATPRRLQCAIDDECTLNCTFLRFFIQKLCRYWADRASEGSLAS